MKKIKKYPLVLLVGRTNVGKSTLFNRLTKNTKSIVFEREGVTRDYVQENITWNKKAFTLIDTGGISFGKSKNNKKTAEIEERIQEKVLELLKKASLLIFVCDGKNGLTQKDCLIAKILHKSNQPTLLTINKTDNKKAADLAIPDFFKLGFKEILPISAIHGTGIADLLDYISNTIPQPIEEIVSEKPSYNIAIIGKPNVGKSSLMNLLIHNERSIVSDVAGTTRESISEKTFHCSDLIQVTDTAGVRRKSRVTDDLESLMVKSTLQSIRESDIVLLMIDSSASKISDQELKLLFYCFEQKIPLLLLYNKVDLIQEDDYTKDRLQKSMDQYEFILRKIPQIAISCITKKNVSKILNQVQKVIERCNQTFNTLEIDEIVKAEIERKPMYHKRQRLKLFRIRHVKNRIPTFTLHVNHKEWWGQGQLGFIENILRKNLDLVGCPIQFHLQKV